MKVLIYELQNTGHRLTYVRHISEALMDLPVEPVIALNQEAPATDAFRQQIQPLMNRVTVDHSLPVGSGGNPLKSARARLQGLMQTIQRHQPDHLYVPYGDGLSQVLGIAWKTGRVRQFPAAEVLLMRGTFAYERLLSKAGLAARLGMHANLWGPWSRIHLIDPLAYETACELFPARKDRLNLLPDPVPPAHPIAQGEARLALGIPKEGRYIGCVGMLDERKGVDQLVHAFARNPHHGERLLLLGQASPAVRAAVDAYPLLLKEKQLILLDRYATDAELDIAIKAMNVVAAVYPRHIGSASIVIRAVAAGRPVLGSDFGWIGWTVKRFGFGWTCDAGEPMEIVNGIRRAFNEYEKWKEPAAAPRFSQFNTLENFKARFTALLRERLGEMHDASAMSWQQVTKTID